MGSSDGTHTAISIEHLLGASRLIPHNLDVWETNSDTIRNHRLCIKLGVLGVIKKWFRVHLLLFYDKIYLLLHRDELKRSVQYNPKAGGYVLLGGSIVHLEPLLLLTCGS